MYDESGKRRWRYDRYVEWPKGTGPSCHRCPKCEGLAESVIRPCPAEGRKASLTVRNYRTLAAYWEQRATGADPACVIDRFARRNFGIVHQLLTNHDTAQLESVALYLKAICQRR
jgi:hypothetical protein